MKAVNLLPRDDGTQGGKRPPVTAVVACGGVALLSALLAMTFLSASSKAGHQKALLAEKQNELNAIPLPTPEAPIVSTLSQQKQDRVAALATVLGARVAWDRVLREISSVVPNDVWLETMTASAPAAGAVAPVDPNAGPTGFSITGDTYSQDAVARFLARLAVIPDLSDVTLKSSSSDHIGNRRIIRFVFAANIRPGGTS